MKIITQEELNTILENHKIWLEDNSKGEKADLSYANLSGADLSYVNLSYANLYNADLSKANLYMADLSSADLSSCDLSNVDLSYADLSFANLFSADLSYANLTRVNLFKVNLSGTNLSNTDLTNLDTFDFILYNTKTDKKYYQVTNIGSREGITTYCVDDTHIFCGCWNDYKGGSLEEFEKRIEEVYGKCGEEPNKKYYKEYKNAIDYFKLCKSEE